jgi:hypothetical protein
VNELLTPDGELQPGLDSGFYFLKNPYLNSEYLGVRMDNTNGASPLQRKKYDRPLTMASTGN